MKKNQLKEINNLFKKHNFEINSNYFFRFAKLSVENREYAKLIFSKSIDEIFKNIKILASEIDINYQEFEHLDIDIILKSFHHLEQDKLKKIILKNISLNKNLINFLNQLLRQM